MEEILKVVGCILGGAAIASIIFEILYELFHRNQEDRND